MSKNLRFTILAALLSGIALALYFLYFPLFPAVSFIKMDFSDVPALMGALLLGPGYGVLVEFIKNLLGMLIEGLGSQMGFGNIMNFSVGVAFILPFSLIFRRGLKKGGGNGYFAMAGAAGILSIVLVGICMNMLIMPLYFRFFVGTEMPMHVIMGVIWYATANNAIKGAMLTASAMLFRPLRKAAGRLLR